MTIRNDNSYLNKIKDILRSDLTVAIFIKETKWIT